MPSLFGTGNVNPKGTYRQLASDDEFSLSDDEKVYFKKSGEIELNLVPGTRIKGAKAKHSRCQYLALCAVVAVVVICLVTVAVVYLRTRAVKPNSKQEAEKPKSSQIKPDDQGDTGNGGMQPSEVEEAENGDGWKVTFKNMAGEGIVRLLDVDGDGVDDVIFGSASSDGSSLILDNEIKQYVGLHTHCLSKGLKYPCMGNLIALNGHNGSQIWSLKVRSEPFVMNCEDFDINKDGKKDCIATGRMGQISAFDPYTGKPLWACEDDKFFQSSWNVYQAAALPDWDDDGVPEVLVANGGNTSMRPDQHKRAPGRLVALSGATGKPLGTRFLDMPNSKETYMSPVMFTPLDGGATYILFGSGGETVAGDLMGISVTDFCRYIQLHNPEVCVHNDSSEYSGIDKDENGIFIIYKGKTKGVMVPPVIVDHDDDGIRDILMTTFEGINNLYDGKNLHLIWSAEFPGMETYGTPAPGYFDDDEYIDFMVTWNFGAWMTYENSTAYVISGKDGSILWSLESAFMQMSSSLSIGTYLQHQNAFLFKVQGRASKFRWTKDGLVKPTSNEARGKRHDEHIPENNIPPIEFRKKSFYSRLTCEDDLTSFRGEVLIIDRKTVKTPVRILDLPTRTHTYYAQPKCSVSDEPGDSVPIMHDGNGPGEVNQEGYMSDVDHDGSDDDGNDDDAVDDDNNDDNDNDDNKPDQVERKQMCVVEDPDVMSSGIIGEVDGDNNLDYISVTSGIARLFDTEYCDQGLLVELRVQKVSLEKGLLDGTFEQVAVDAQTKLEDAGKHSPVQSEKTFLPMSQQRWTQYFGTKDNNVYR